MGLTGIYLAPVRESVARTIGSLSGVRMLELGNQRMHDRAIPERTGKEYFLHQGVAEHVSIDLNGRDGSLPVDLAVVHTDPPWRGHFDVVTNFGTTQHVEPRRAQYACFLNIHNWLRPG